MIQLIINGIWADLPEDISIRLIRENPTITQSSDFTLDISLSLHTPANARIFGYISPIWAKKKTFKYPATIRIDNVKLLSGSIVPLEVTESDIKIQFLSGNSEFNYTVKDDVYITDLVLPVVSKIDKWTVRMEGPDDGSISPWAIFPKNNWMLHPIVNRTTGQLSNRWSAHSMYDTTIKATIVWLKLDENSPRAIQPFLCSMIREIFKAIGYTVAENVIENSPFNQLVIFNSSITYRWCDVLPKWTVREFIENIECLFQVKIIVAGTSIYIRQKSNQLPDATVELDRIIDEYESSDEPEESPGYNIAYDLSSEDVDPIDNLPDNIMELFGEKHFTTWGEMRDWVIDNETEAFKTLLRLKDKTWTLWDNATEYELRHIDNWGGLNLGFKNTKKIGFAPIIDTQSVVFKGTIWNNGQLLINIEKSKAIHTVPGSSISDQNQNYEENLSVRKYLEEDLPERYYPEKLYVGFIHYVESFSTDLTSNCWYVSDSKRIAADLRLQRYANSIGTEFHQNPVRYSTQQCKLKFLYPGIPEVNQVFLIKGKRYVCKQIEVDITNEGISDLKEGIFYEITT